MCKTTQGRAYVSGVAWTGRIAILLDYWSGELREHGSSTETVKQVGGGSDVESAPYCGCISAFSLLHPGALGEVLLPLVSHIGLFFLIPSFLFPVFFPQGPLATCLSLLLLFLPSEFPSLSFPTTPYQKPPCKAQFKCFPSKKLSSCLPGQRELCFLGLEVLFLIPSSFFGSRAIFSSGCLTEHGITQPTWFCVFEFVWLGSLVGLMVISQNIWCILMFEPMNITLVGNRSLQV